MNPSTRQYVANFLLFQVGWFACVLGASQRQPWLGPVVVALLVAVHLARVADARGEGKLIAAVLLIGLLWDSLLLNTQWIVYRPSAWPDWLAPAWILALWALFATTLNVSLRWLQTRTVLAIVIGGIAGPLSYLAGTRLGAATLAQPVPALFALMVGWAALMPLLLHLASRCEAATSRKVATL